VFGGYGWGATSPNAARIKHVHECSIRSDLGDDLGTRLKSLKDGMSTEVPLRMRAWAFVLGSDRIDTSGSSPACFCSGHSWAAAVCVSGSGPRTEMEPLAVGFAKRYCCSVHELDSLPKCMRSTIQRFLNALKFQRLKKKTYERQCSNFQIQIDILLLYLICLPVCFEKKNGSRLLGESTLVRMQEGATWSVNVASGTLTGTRACFADIVSGRWFNLHISHLPTHHSPKPIHDTTYHQHGTHMMVQKQNVSKGQGFMHHEHSLLHFQSSRQSSVPRLRKPCMYGWMYGSFLY
jgi:hypothetical protein